MNSNTSHVNLYLYRRRRYCCKRTYSNTSHVNLYRSHSSDHRRTLCIQIHLMLIFIQISHKSFYFQLFIQIHLMLIFICSVTGGYGCEYCIQIHLMLIFISEQELRVGGVARHSNTSHVNLYQHCITHYFSLHMIQIHLMLIFIADDARSSMQSVLFKYISC